MNPLFDTVKVKRPKGNVFNLSAEKKLSCHFNNLTPIFLQEIVPGDKFKVSTEMLIRLAPMMAPMMHRVNAYVHYFFVPNRLVWDNWEDFITGGRTGLLAPTFPSIAFNNANKSYFLKGTLADYFGLPAVTGSNLTQTMNINALPFRAYQQIYNDYYRDPNLSDPISFLQGDLATDVSTIATIRKRCWEKDYFTSALPWVQRGADVSLPFVGNVTPSYKSQSNLLTSAGGTPADGSLTNVGQSLRSGAQNLRVENLNTMQVTATGLTINDLRQSLRLQEWLEKNARGGARYVEQILMHFGVVSSDARLQRAEYLGGGKTPIVVSEVLATAENQNDGVGVGDMYGHGIGVGNTNQFIKSFEEHGYVIGILSVLPRTAYQQGVNKMWRKTTKFDFYFPEFAHLGEQVVDQSELYYDGIAATNGVTFGYQSRFAEYKYTQSSVHGDFRDNYAYWHMGRIFTGPPSLNTSFVEADSTKRVFRVTDPAADELYIQLYNKVMAIRPMPYFGTPSL